WFDASDTASITSASNIVSAVANKRAGSGNLNYAGTAGKISTGIATRNSLNALRVTRDVSTTTALPRLAALSTDAISTMFQGDDKPYTVIIVYKPTDANTGFIWSSSDTIDATNAQCIALVRRSGSASSVRRQLLT